MGYGVLGFEKEAVSFLWYGLIETGQPTRLFNLYENIFRHCCPCQFKVQNTAEWLLICCCRDHKIKQTIQSTNNQTTFSNQQPLKAA